MILLSAILAASILPTKAAPDKPPIDQAVFEAIQDEIEYGLEASREQDIERYMEGVPADTRIVEEDGSIIGRDQLKEIKRKEWAIIPKTNFLDMTITGFEIGCDGRCATVWTDQKWDRQMLGRDGKSEFNVVTTQKHKERWEERDSRWVNVDTVELGGSTMVDGKPY